MWSLKVRCSNGETCTLPYEDTVYRLKMYWHTAPSTRHQIMLATKTCPNILKEIQLPL